MACVNKVIIVGNVGGAPDRRADRMARRSTVSSVRVHWSSSPPSSFSSCRSHASP